MVKVNSEIEAKNSSLNPITSETRSFIPQIDYEQIHSDPTKCRLISSEIRFILMGEWRSILSTDKMDRNLPPGKYALFMLE